VKEIRREIRVARYFNTNYHAMIIIAAINHGLDWAVYATGVAPALPEEEAAQWCSKYGAKMSRMDAEHFFPDVKLPYRY